MTSLAKLASDPSILVVRMRVGTTEPTQLRRAIAKLKTTGNGSERRLEDIGEVQHRIAEWATSHSPRALSRRDLRAGCHAILHPPFPLAEQDAVLNRLTTEVERNKRRAAFFALIDAYLDGFEEKNPTIDTLARKLTGMADRWPWRETDNWPFRFDEFDLLNPDRAPDLLATEILRGHLGPDEVLRQAGLDTPGRKFGGLVEAAFRAACNLVKRMSGQDAISGQRVLISWAKAENGDFGYQKAWPEFVEASLVPWEIVEPSEAHKSALLEMLEKFGRGDPRAKPQRWRVVMDKAPGAYAVLMRWLTRASVLQFLDIVDRLMPDDAAKLMWAYRRAFWMSYLLSDGNSPGIDAAWVAFGDEGARLAEKVARESGDRSFTAFGKQHDKTAQHAALIIKMGDLTIVDWSHSAKYQVWRRGEKGAPDLFQDNYKYGSLYSAPLQDSHVSPRTYSWQKRLAQIIEGRAFLTEKRSWRP